MNKLILLITYQDQEHFCHDLEIQKYIVKTYFCILFSEWEIVSCSGYEKYLAKRRK